MKKQTTKQKDLRADWKNEFQDEFIQLQEDIDTLELPEDMVLEIENYINRFKDRLNDRINEFEITAKIALQNNELLSDMLYEVKYDGLSVSDEDTVKDMLEMAGYFVISAPSLSEQIRLEAFIEDLKANPYQLQLIA